jgi:hypothetical protein
VSEAAALRLSAPHIVAIMLVGVVGVLIAGLQPQLLGAMATEGRLSAARLGLVATVELLAMGIGAGGAGAVLDDTRLRPIAAAAAVALALTDMATPTLDGAAIVIARAAAGFAEGVLIWITIGLIARAAESARWAAIYLMLQTLAQLALAALLARAVLPAWGSAGGFVTLALASLLPLLALRWLPAGYPPLAHGDAPNGLPPATGFLALAGVLLYLAFVVAVWVYIEPLGRQAGIGATITAYAVPFSLGMQVLGAGSAALLAARLPAPAVMLIVSALDLGILIALGSSPGPALFLALAATFGFLWLFMLPFQVALVIAADPSRRAALLIAGAQLLGSSFGPLAASGIVSDTDVRPVLWLGAICIVVSAALMLMANARRPQP